MSFKVKNYLKCKTKYGKKLAVKWIKNLTVSVFIVIQKDKKKIIHQDKKKSYGNKINTNFQAKKIAQENARFCY